MFVNAFLAHRADFASSEAKMWANDRDAWREKGKGERYEFEYDIVEKNLSVPAPENNAQKRMPHLSHKVVRHVPIFGEEIPHNASQRTENYFQKNNAPVGRRRLVGKVILKWAVRLQKKKASLWDDPSSCIVRAHKRRPATERWGFTNSI